MEITYWSDYACPYCYIGEARLKKALKDAGLEDDVVLTMKAFQLDPGAPRHAATSTVTRYGAKYGLSAEDAQRSVDQINALGAAEGLEMNYADTLFTNTMDAHRLAKLAKSKDDPEIYEKLNDLLFRAYFKDAKELADPEVLIAAAVEAGLSEDEVRTLLEGTQFFDEVRADEREAATLGVSAVPYFVIDNVVAVPGAVSAENFEEVFRKLPEYKEQIRQQVEARQGEAAKGSGCGPDGCSL